MTVFRAGTARGPARGYRTERRTAWDYKTERRTERTAARGGYAMTLTKYNTGRVVLYDFRFHITSMVDAYRMNALHEDRVRVRVMILHELPNTRCNGEIAEKGNRMSDRLREYKARSESVLLELVAARQTIATELHENTEREAYKGRLFLRPVAGLHGNEASEPLVLSVFRGRTRPKVDVAGRGITTAMWTANDVLQYALTLYRAVYRSRISKNVVTFSLEPTRDRCDFGEQRVSSNRSAVRQSKHARTIPNWSASFYFIFFSSSASLHVDPLCARYLRRLRENRDCLRLRSLIRS